MLDHIKENAKRFLSSLGLQETKDAIIGLDIGPTYIKLLKINSSIHPYKLEDFLVTKTPDNAIVKDEIKDIEAISQAINELKNTSSINSNAVAFAVPRSRVLTKTIFIDRRMSPSEIENRAWFEVNKHFPDLVGDIYLDFIINENVTQGDSQVELTLVVCRKAQIDPYLKILAATDLTPKIVDVNSYALERALRFTMPSMLELETVALLNVNENMSSLVVIHQNAMIHAHDQSFDGQRVQKQTDEYFAKQDSKESETLEPEYETILKENFISHLRHTMHFFYSSRPQIRIQKIILSGDLACIPKLNLFIQKEMNVETEIATPFKQMSLSTHIDPQVLKKYSPTLMECCGLALSKKIVEL